VDATGKSILVVDDEPAILEALAEILAWEGFTVRTAANGREALDLLTASPADIVLTDVMMPVATGLDLLTAMRSDPRLRHTPVVFMTAGPIPEPRDRTLGVRKPFTLQLLLAALDKALTWWGGPSNP
jgi:CheY-like chemotaxis protein